MEGIQHHQIQGAPPPVTSTQGRHSFRSPPSTAASGRLSAQFYRYFDPLAPQEEALEMINAFREQLASGAVEFGALATSESHCSSARRGGDLGEFGPGQMQPAFEDVRSA